METSAKTGENVSLLFQRVAEDLLSTWLQSISQDIDNKR